MPISTIIKCDLCGRERLQTNHWFVGFYENNRSISIHPFKMDNIDSYVQKVYITILCGESCVHKFISQNLTSLHTPSQSDRPIAKSEQQSTGYGNLWNLKGRHTDAV